MIFPPALIHALTLLGAIAGVAIGVYLLVTRRAGWRILPFVAYCAGLLALFLLDRSGIESAAALWAGLIWIAVAFGLSLWTTRKRGSRPADMPTGG